VKDGAGGPRFPICLGILRLLMTRGFILPSLQPFPGNYLIPVKFQSPCDARTYFEVAFLKSSELETTPVLGSGQYGDITAQHPCADPCVWRYFYRHPWGSTEWCMSSWSNSLRKECPTCAARSLLPVAPLQVVRLLLLHSDTPWALHIANRKRNCKRSW